MGFIQTIRLMLDRGALMQMQRDAAAASQMVAQTLTQELGNGKSAEQAVLKYATRLRRVFEKTNEDLRVKVSKGLISPAEAEKAAVDLGNRMTAKLAQAMRAGIGRNLNKDLKKKVIDAMVPKPEELKFAAQNAVSRMWSQLSSSFRIPDLKLINIPGAEPLSGKVSRKLMTQAKGDTLEHARLVREHTNAIRVQNTTLTRTGQLLQMLGVNVRKLSAEYRSLGGSTKMVTQSTAQLVSQGKFLQAILGGIGAAAIRTGAAFAGMFAFQRLGQVMKESLVVAADTEATYARLAVTLADFGVAADQAWVKVEPLMKQLSGMGYKPTFTAEVLATLVQITGNYEESLRGVVPVLDLVVSRHMTWETAARVVGRAIIGDIGHIQRHGIFLDKTKNTLDQIIERFKDEAFQRSLTLRGQLDRASVAWFNFQNAMGQVLAQAMRNVKFFDTLTVSVTALTSVFQGQRGLIEIFVRVAGWFMKFVAMTAILVDSIGTVVRTIWNFGALMVVFAQNTYERTTETWGKMWRNMYQVALLGAEKIASVVKTMTFGLIDGTEKIRGLAEANLAELAKLGRSDPGSQRAQRFNNAATRLMMGMQGMSTDVPDNPLDRGMALGSAGHIIAREEEKLNKEILQLRKNAFSENADRSERAMERLNELYDQQVERLKDVGDNKAKQMVIENHMTTIEKIRSDLAKRRAADEKKAAKDSEVNTRIALLARIALLDKEEDSVRALQELTEIERTLRAERDRTSASTERYFVLTDRLLKIEQAREAVRDKQFERNDLEITKLAEMVELDVDRADAIRQLTDMQARLIEQSNDMNQTQEDRVRIQRQLLDITKAIGIEDDIVSNQIDRYKEWLRVAEKREMAEYRLVALRKTLQDRLDKEAMTQERRLRIEEQLRDVMLSLEGKFDLRSMTRAVSSIDDMVKNGKNRAEGLAMAIKLQDQLNNAMEAGNLTLEEQLQVYAMLERIRRKIIQLHKPELNFWKDLKDTFATELVPAIENSARNMADHVVTAFERMSSSLKDFGRNAKEALKSIPASVLAAMTDGVRQIAQDKIKEHIAEAAGEAAIGFGMLAKGNAKGAGLAFKSSAMHMLAAAKWGLLGGAAGAATTGLLGGPGSSSSGRNAKADKQLGPDITIYIDGVDPGNTRHQLLVGNTLKQYEERYGTRARINPSGG